MLFAVSVLTAGVSTKRRCHLNVVSKSHAVL